MYDSFDNTYQATIGIDFLSKTMYLEDRTVSGHSSGQHHEKVKYLKFLYFWMPENCTVINLNFCNRVLHENIILGTHYLQLTLLLGSTNHLGERTGLVVRALDSGSGDPGSILGRVGVLFP